MSKRKIREPPKIAITFLCGTKENHFAFDRLNNLRILFVPNSNIGNCFQQIYENVTGGLTAIEGSYIINIPELLEFYKDDLEEQNFILLNLQHFENFFYKDPSGAINNLYYFFGPHDYVLP